ncbi:MAG TPA: hypothetical protein VLF16_04505 [Pseudomonas sp.]|nr:hypothetical protein [Pseudomonas sp.]
MHGNFKFRFEPRWEVFRLGADDAGFTSAPGSSEVLVPGCQVLLPVGVLLPGRILEVFFGGAKTSNAETFTPRIHLGPAGTLADPTLAGFNPAIAATTRSFDAGARFKVRTNTTIQRVGSTQGTAFYGNSATGAEVAADTISDVTTTPLYVSLSGQMGGTVEWVKIQHMAIVISG